MKLVITGGHPSPAFALVEYIQNVSPETDLLMIGRTSTVRSAKQPAWEQQTAERSGVPFFGIQSGRSNASTMYSRVREFVLTLQSGWQALQILRKTKPDVCVSFGSYVAVPTVIAAFLLHIPIITHEQTHRAGKSNRLIGRFAKKIAISYPTSAPYFPAHKTELTGLPLRPSLFVQQAQPGWFTPAETKPLLVILGGSTGSHAINARIVDTITRLVEYFTVIHQTGLPSDQANWLQTAQNKRQSLTKPDLYFPVPTISEGEMAWVYQHASVALSRAGANTVAELLAFSIPTIFIPLPYSASDEQLENATHACSVQPSNRLLNQTEVTEQFLLQTLQEMSALQTPAPNPTQNLQPHKHLFSLIKACAHTGSL